ncbi:hypothetical protein M8494_09410 [Serratia ureilytica]
MPIDPRLARMVLEAQKSGSVREVMIITAALSIQDRVSADGQAAGLG